MNTIIYFYQKRDLREPAIDVRTEAGKKAMTTAGTEAEIRAVAAAGSEKQEYVLIRVGLNLAGELWFGQNIGQTMPEETQALFEMEEPDVPCKKGIFGVLQRIRQEKLEMKRMVEAQLRLEQALSAREEQLKATEKQMRLAAERILKRADGESECRYVCGENLKKCAAWRVWLNRFPVKEFDGYLQGFWIKQLLPHAVYSRFVILGACEGIDALIEDCAHRMKSLRWILKEQEYTLELMDFVERFCEEYGLAIALQTVSGRTAYRKLKLVCPEPANILDFTEETGILTSGVAEGSVWLDMRSSEEKYRRIAGRGTGILYFSLRERWKRS